jgi:hypothetical protein
MRAWAVRPASLLASLPARLSNVRADEPADSDDDESAARHVGIALPGNE